MAEQDYLFHGLKVLDVATYIAGPAAATVLADFGADVIKIEPPGEGDPYRHLSALPHMPQTPDNYGWQLDARNKRSLALDLKSEAGQAVLHRLVADADVFLTNMPLPARKRLRIRYGDIAPGHPRLIYASLTAYGETGPDADKTGFDSTAYWARTGLADMVRSMGSDMPSRSLPGMGDHPTAMSLFAAIVMALYRRQSTGQGGEVGTSLMSNGLWANGIFTQARLAGASFPIRRPRDQAPNALTNIYRCGDGRWFLLALVGEERQWAPFLEAIGHTELAEDPRFVDKPNRHANSVALVAVLDEIFATRPYAHWRRAIDAAGLPFGEINTMDDVYSDSQPREAGAFIDLPGQHALASETIASPLWLSGAAKRAPGPAPDLGEHSEGVLREAGYDEAEIAALRAAGVIG